MLGYILEGRGGLYTVRECGGERYVLRAKKKFRREGISPLVGDDVRFTPGSGQEHGWLEEILPRRTLCPRPPVANISQLVITLAPEPQPDLLLLDKLLIFAGIQGFSAVIAVNKSDLKPDLAGDIARTYEQSGRAVLAVSALTGLGLLDLETRMAGHLNCFAGQSGTGKSTLITKLTGQALKTGEISQKIQRGKQTTRHVTLLEAQGLRVLDTPGFSLLDLPDDMEPETLRNFYPEFDPCEGQCRFSPCMHDREPDCAVRDQVESGLIDRDRWERYRKLLHQAEEKRRNKYD